MIELRGRKSQHFFRRLEQPPSAGMEQKSVEVREPKTVAVEKILQGRLKRFTHQCRQFWTEHNAETVVLDVPAHDVFGAAPAPFADGEDPRAGAKTCNLPAAPRIVQQHAGRAVAEQ